MSTKDDIKKELQEQGRHDRGPSRTRVRKPERHGAPRRGLSYGVGSFGYFGLPTYGQNYYRGISGDVTAATGGGATSAPYVGNPTTPHLNPEQFVGYPGGYRTDAGNYTGVQALIGAAGNGSAGGDGSGSGDGGGGAGAAGGGGSAGGV